MPRLLDVSQNINALGTFKYFALKCYVIMYAVSRAHFTSFALKKHVVIESFHIW